MLLSRKPPRRETIKDTAGARRVGDDERWLMRDGLPLTLDPAQVTALHDARAEALLASAGTHPAVP